MPVGPTSVRIIFFLPTEAAPQVSMKPKQIKNMECENPQKPGFSAFAQAVR